MQAGVRRRFGPGRHTVAVPIGAALACAAALALGGCAQSMARAEYQTSDVSSAIARGAMRSPKAAALAFSSIEGGPENVVARLKQSVTAEAGRRQITIADPIQARYFVRGYIDAYASDTGTSVRLVWDVYDAHKKRIERLDDGLELPRAGADPWAGVDDAVLANIAARSADVIAAYLATTPEAAEPSERTASAAMPAGPR